MEIHILYMVVNNILEKERAHENRIDSRIKKIITYGILISVGFSTGAGLGVFVGNQVYMSKLNSSTRSLRSELRKIKDKVDRFDGDIHLLNERVDSLSDEVDDLSLELAQANILANRKKILDEQKRIESLRVYEYHLDEWKSKPWWLRIFYKKPKPE